MTQESMSPVFSIVVPTRNRPDLVGDAVASVLEQTFSDLELIVSDNSDPGAAEINQRVLKPFHSDPRFCYVRPDRNLSMVDHWEWAIGHARGQYIGIVTDRMALRLYALEEIHTVVRQTNAAVVGYGSTNAREIPGYRSLRSRPARIGARAISTAEKLEAFARGELPKDTPRMLNSFAHKELLDGFRQRYDAVFAGISPDYLFAFRALDALNSYMFIDYPLLVTQGEMRSNGNSLTVGAVTNDNADFKRRMHQEQRKWLQYGPIPGDSCVLLNGILREYMAVAEKSRSGRFPEVLPADFYRGAMAQAAGLARKAMLPPNVADVLDSYRAKHHLAPVLLPRPKNGLRRYARLLAGGQAGPLWLQRMIGSLRLRIETSLMKLGLGSHIAGRSLIDIIRQDSRYRESKP